MQFYNWKWGVVKFDLILEMLIFVIILLCRLFLGSAAGPDQEPEKIGLQQYWREFKY